MGQKKSVKLEDIAEKLGVSIVTVSNALKDKGGVSDGLRKRIKETAEEQGYRMPPREEKKLTDTYLIGVLVAERYVKEYPSFYMDIYKWIAQETAKKGHLTVLEVVTKEKENFQQDFLTFLDDEIGALILIGELRQAYIRALRAACKLPIVCVDYYDVYDDMDYIVADSFGGMEQMTKLLLKEGYRDLMFVGTVNATKNITDRYLGYCKALRKAGIEDAQKKILKDRELQGDYRLKVELQEELPEGFVCNCDKTALVLIEALEKRGVKVPEDVAVVSFDHFYPQAQEGLRLTTYENDGRSIARISVNTLMKRLEGKTSPEGVRVVEGRIIRGDTVKFRRNM